MGTGWLKAIHPDDREQLLKTNRELQVGPPGQSITADGIRGRHVMPDGSTHWFVSKKRLQYDDEGKLRRSTIAIMDLTGLRELEEENALLTQNLKLQTARQQETESRYRATVSDLPGFTYRLRVFPDKQLEMLHVSENCSAIYGVDAQSFLVGKHSFRDFEYEDDREAIDRWIEASSSNPVSTSMEFRIVLLTGEQRWVRTTAHPEPRPNQSLTWHGVIADITKEKNAELALRESERRFASLAAFAPVAIARFNAKGECIYVNDRWAEQTNRPVESAFGYGYQDAIHPEDFQKLLEHQVAFIADTERIESVPVEVRHVLPDGSFHWVQSHASKELDEDGRLVGFIVTLSDIDERKNAELALLDSQMRFERMTENVPGMIYRYVVRTDGSHYMEYVSSKIREMYDVDPEAAMQNADCLFECIHPDDLARLKKAVEDSASQLSPFDQEYRVYFSDQGMRWRRAISQPSKTPEGFVAWDGVTIDITAEKQAERQLQLANEKLAHATKMKDEFLANMSHELRTPLNAILGLNEGLQEGIFGPVSEQQRNSFDVIQQSGAHLLELINEVLDLAKIESGSLELESSPIRVSELCERSLQLVTLQAAQKNIGLNLSVPFDLPMFEGDKKRLRQVLVNLLSNAVKFTPDGGRVRVDVQKVVAENRGDSILKIAISDTGIGIGDADLETLFDPFFQVDSSLSRNYSGTGLGLSVAKQFVTLHGGTLTVKSELGTGSCFTVELPYRESNHRDDLPQATHDKAISAGKQRNVCTTVLLAEDNASVAMATKLYLESHEMDVVVANNGEQAIELAQKTPPDLILMDIQMPGLDGFTAIGRIRSLPSHKRTPIIALTGLAMPSDEARCLEAGANAYLSKPYSMASLVQAIEKLLH